MTQLKRKSMTVAEQMVTASLVAVATHPKFQALEPEFRKWLWEEIVAASVTTAIDYAKGNNILRISNDTEVQ